MLKLNFASMKLKGYDFQNSVQYNQSYWFVSTGKNGNITKIVFFQEVSDIIYNLVLGDFNTALSPPIDVFSVSDNGDLTKIMATVVHIAEYFLNQNPDFFVYLEGNTATKKLLYQRIMRNYYQDFEVGYDIFGIDIQDDVAPFDPTQEYKAFLIRKKI